MHTDRYTAAIEQLLQQIPELERNLSASCCKEDRILIERSLKMRRKRFEHLIPYKFRLKLKNICNQVGVTGDFM